MKAAAQTSAKPPPSSLVDAGLKAAAPSVGIDPSGAASALRWSSLRKQIGRLHPIGSIERLGGRLGRAPISPAAAPGGEAPSGARVYPAATLTRTDAQAARRFG